MSNVIIATLVTIFILVVGILIAEDNIELPIILIGMIVGFGVIRSDGDEH